MILSINTTFDAITINSTLLDSFIAAPASYKEIEVIGQINCTGNLTSKVYKSTSPITASTDVRTNAGVETIVPNFFGFTTYGNGIYSFTVKLTTNGGNTSTDAGCLFIDKDLKCTIPVEDYKKQMLHYTLVQSQDCNCNCTKLCDIYIEIIDEECKTCNCN